MRKKIVGALTALMLSGGLMTAGSANAGLLGSVTTVAAVVNTPQVCKTVVVVAATAAELEVGVGGHTKSIDLRGIVATDVTVCVEADAAVLARLVVLLDAPRLHNGALVVTGRIRSFAAVDADVAVKIKVGGYQGFTRVVRTCDFSLVPVLVGVDVPILVAAKVV